MFGIFLVNQFSYFIHLAQTMDGHSEFLDFKSADCFLQKVCLGA